jgi:hypothetical protein
MRKTFGRRPPASPHKGSEERKPCWIAMRSAMKGPTLKV